MNLALPTVGCDPFWQLWSAGAADLGYSPTGASAGRASRATWPGWIDGARAAAANPVGITAATLFSLLVGTGGTADYLSASDPWGIPTSASPDRGLAGLGERAVPAVALDGAELVAEIKATLGVSVTDLAAIVRVSRQSIYDWIGGGQVSEANDARLRALHQVCQDWQSRVERPVGRLLRTKTADGPSLFDLLVTEPLDLQAVQSHLMVLTAKACEQLGERQARGARLAPLSEKDRYENALTHALPAAHS